MFMIVCIPFNQVNSLTQQQRGAFFDQFETIKSEERKGFGMMYRLKKRGGRVVWPAK